MHTLCGVHSLEREVYNEILEFVPEPLSPLFQDEDDEDEGDDETSTD